MKSLITLWQVIAEELGDRCSTSTSRDFETLTARVEHEGLSFLTITLPQFAKDFERSLDAGCVSRNLFQGFSWKGGLPRFLVGFLGQVFDRTSGRLVDTPSIDAIQAVRQLTMLFGKLELPTTQTRYRKAMEGFVNCEEEVRKGDISRSADFYAEFGRIALLIWANVLVNVDKTLYDEHRGPSGDNPGWPFLIPKHGPGATADRLKGNLKFDITEWPARLDSVFPFVEYALPSHRHFDCLDRVNFPEPGAERPVRVIAVPKTMKTPRIIAIEPTAMQFMQQGVKDILVHEIESDPVMGRIVGFSDQIRNRDLARVASLTRGLATLDLSEASDRVSYSLVQTMLQRFPHVAEAVDATRSRLADVDGYGVIPLAKYASMGSALTFPVEAMVFATVVFHGIEKALNRPLTRSDVTRLREKVRVYGDDIIVPTDYVHSVMRSLELFGFKVNASKSFWTGGFRESCGKEYYDGEDVSIVRLRQVVQEGEELGFPSSLRRHADVIESFVMLRNNFYVAGMWQTVSWLDGQISALFRGKYPCIPITYDSSEGSYSSGSPLLGRWSFLGYQSERTHPGRHVPLVEGYVARSNSPASEASGVGSLHKVLSSKARRKAPDHWSDALFAGNADADHLQRAGRPRAVYIKRVYACPY